MPSLVEIGQMGSGEEDENVKSSQTDRQTDGQTNGQTNGRQTTGDLKMLNVDGYNIADMAPREDVPGFAAAYLPVSLSNRCSNSSFFSVSLSNLSNFLSISE